MDKKVTPAWLKTADRDPLARALAAGAEGFLVAHDVPHTTFTEAAKRGDYVSTVVGELKNVGRAVRSDRLSDRIDDIRIVDFWQEEIERAAKRRPPSATNG